MVIRMPIVDEKAPRECDFDAMLSELKGADTNTACVFNCQMGKGRTTTGMIVACLIRDVLSSKRPSYPSKKVCDKGYQVKLDLACGMDMSLSSFSDLDSQVK